MASTFQLEIVTPERATFSGEVSEVTVPGRIGELGILPGHLPLMTLTQPGELRAQTSDGERVFAVGAGFAEVGVGRVSVLVSSCEGADEIDVEHARSMMADAEKELDAHNFKSEQELEDMRDQLASSRARIAVAERATKH